MAGAACSSPRGLLAAVALIVCDGRRARAAALAGATAALLLAPSAWALDTLGHAESGTFPAGGPASVATAGGPFGGSGARRSGLMGPPAGAGALRARPPAFPGAGTAPPSGGEGAAAPGMQAPSAGARGGPMLFGSAPAGPGGGGFAGPGAGGGPFGSSSSLSAILAYVQAHGGGTVAVASQSSAASAIIAKGAAVAGIGGFSGRESDVSARWLAEEVSSGRIRWVLAEEGAGGRFGGRFGGPPGDTRTGARTAMAAVASACTRVQTSSSSTAGALYDCRGSAAELARAGGVSAGA